VDTPSHRIRCGILASAAAIATAAIAAYSNSISVPFVFDDPFAIASNPTIRHLWPPWAPLFPPHGQGLTVEGRPLLNLSLALDYAVSGTRVWSYHATNLLIHILAGLTLFGIARRTLTRWKDTFPDPWFAAVIALIWTLHPLQTESVTYIVQRAESQMGLFYLLTLYFFIRYSESEGSLQASSPAPSPMAGGGTGASISGWAPRGSSSASLSSAPATAAERPDSGSGSRPGPTRSPNATRSPVTCGSRCGLARSFSTTAQPG